MKPLGHQTDFAKIELPHDILSLKQHAQKNIEGCKREKTNNTKVNTSKSQQISQQQP
jgi:hypothetical protein